MIKSKYKVMAKILSSIFHDYNIYIQRQNRLPACYKNKTQDIEHYGFIPFNDIIDLIEVLFNIYNKFHNKRPKFLDIGCGIGNIVQIAHRVGFDSYGLEYDTQVYMVATKLVSSFQAHIIKGDMLKFERYHKFDVLYYYQPIANNEVMTKFAEKLVNEMKVGSYVIPIGTKLSFHKSKAFRKVEPIITTYKKVGNA